MPCILDRFGTEGAVMLEPTDLDFFRTMKRMVELVRKGDPQEACFVYNDYLYSRVPSSQLSLTFC